VLIQTARVNVLLDPMLAFDSGDDGRLSFRDLPDRIDYVVLTHNHQDHVSPEMLLELRHRVGRVLVPRNNSGNPADPSMKLILRELGYGDIDVLDTFDEVAIPGGLIMSLPFQGEHADLSLYSKQTLCVSLDGRNLLFLVDSDGRDPMLYERIARRLGRPMDAVFLGMECHGAPLSWLYGPLLPKAQTRRNDESRRLSGADCERAWRVIRPLRAQQVFVYALGQEPWLRYIMGLEYTTDSYQLQQVASFTSRCQAEGIGAEKLYLKRELFF
jgi:hypothetical protein